MDKDRIAGSAKQVKGFLKTSLGKAMGDSKLVADGEEDRVVGKAQNAIGGIKDAAREALEK